MYMIKVRKVLCYFSGLVLTLAGIPFLTEFISESEEGQQVQYISIYPVIGSILMGFGILVCAWHRVTTGFNSWWRLYNPNLIWTSASFLCKRSNVRWSA